MPIVKPNYSGAPLESFNGREIDLMLRSIARTLRFVPFVHRNLYRTGALGGSQATHQQQLGSCESVSYYCGAFSICIDMK